MKEGLEVDITNSPLNEGSSLPEPHSPGVSHGSRPLERPGLIPFLFLGGALMAANPEYKWPAQNNRTEMAQEIRLRWPEIMEGLIQAAIRGNVRAFLVLREEAWGVPISGGKQDTGGISSEELVSADKGVAHPRGQRSNPGIEGTMNSEVLSGSKLNSEFSTFEASPREKTRYSKPKTQCDTISELQRNLSGD